MSDAAGWIFFGATILVAVLIYIPFVLEIRALRDDLVFERDERRKWRDIAYEYAALARSAAGQKDEST